VVTVSMRGEPPFDRASREEASLWVARTRGLAAAIEARREGRGDGVVARATRPGAGRLLHRRLRTLCEDLDERLGTVAEAVRQQRITAAAGLLGDAVTIAGELASYLSAARPAPADAMHPATERHHEADVLRALVRVRGLDDELHRAAQGDGDGDGSLRAGALLAEIRTLAGAARFEAAAPRPGITLG